MASDTSVAIVGPATTGEAGIVKKAAALSSPPPVSLANATSGTASGSLNVLSPISQTVTLIATLINTINTLLGIINDNFATVYQQIDAEKSRVEDLITKQQAAGQQT